MILDDFVEIKVCDKYCKYWREKGYENVKTGIILSVKVSDLEKNSHTKVNCKCDICGIEKKLKLQVYNKSYNKYNKYTCEKCRYFKIKLTNNEILGCDNPFQSQEVREKSKKTNLERRGCEYSMQSEEVREKSKKTNLERRGCEYATQSKDVRKKTEETNLRKRGYKSPAECEDVKNKMRETNLKIRGVENPYQCEKSKEKAKQTNLRKRGVEYATQSKDVRRQTEETNLKKRGYKSPAECKDVRNKMEETCLKNNGVRIATQSKDIYNKIRETKIKKKQWTSNIDTSEFHQYRLKVVNITNSFKKQLFENWDGYDYYSKEYIKDNLKLHPNSKDYPTIDHKISRLYGFQNNIPVEIIGHIDNLCITTRSNNSSKSSKITFK
jgi:hypothetical protein